jgi:hypothetical protein
VHVSHWIRNWRLARCLNTAARNPLKPRVAEPDTHAESSLPMCALCETTRPEGVNGKRVD